MQTSSKPSGARATGSPPNQFHAARLRLTLVYAALLAAILGISSFLTYVTFSQRLERGPVMARIRQIEKVEHENTPKEETDELLSVLLFSNGILLILASGLSYWLAGITLRPIQQAYERQKHFMGDASHELRTPLAILRTDIENALSSSKKGKPVEADLSGSIEEVDRMTGLVGDLLMLSRTEEAGHAAMQNNQVDISKLAVTTAKRLAGYAQKHEVTLMSEVVESGLRVRGDEELLLKALGNLVKNAIDYNRPRGSVTISAKKIGNEACVTVADTGIGMSEEEISHVFDRFYRADQSRSRKMGGSGLGLPIVKAIADQHGGKVSMESLPDKGTTVSLRIPLT
jgi:signal transduction histidine kinase